MHQTILIQRQLSARRRIVERLTALVQHLELDPALADALLPSGIRDHTVAEMIQLEAVAGALDAIAENAGVRAPAVTDVTVNKFIAPPETYAVTDGGPVQAEEIERPAILVEAEDASQDQAPARRTSRTSGTSGTKKKK